MSNYSGRYQVIGPPGTGKTTQLGAQVKACLDEGTTVCVSSLTRAAAVEVVRMREKTHLAIPRDHIATLHAHAYRAIGRPKLYIEEVADWNERNPYLRMRDARSDDRSTDDLLNLPAVGEYPGDELYEAVDLRRHQQVPAAAWSEDQREFFALWTAWKDEAEVIDFTDMIERGLSETRTPIHEPQVLLADEAQDLSALEYALLCHWGEASKAMFITGDPWQALYTWRGAEPKLFRDAGVPDDQRKVLSQSYRVPRAVHAVAMRWVAGLSDHYSIEYQPREFDGVAERFYDGTHLSPWAVVQAAREVADSGRTAMIIATCGYMLKPTVMTLRQRGIPFANPWRTKRGDWNPLRYRKNATTTPQRLLAFLKPVFALYPADDPDSFCSEPDSLYKGDDRDRVWTLQDLSQWTDLLASDGCLHRGAKTALKALAKETPNRLVEPEDIKAFLKDEAFAVAVLMLANDMKPVPCVEWLRQNALASKQAALTYPLAIIEQSGVDALSEKPSIYVGTAHSFKGAEADVVFVYPEVSNAAAEHAMRYGSDDLIRTFYVAMTRAREELYVCMKCDSRAVEIEL